MGREFYYGVLIFIGGIGGLWLFFGGRAAIYAVAASLVAGTWQPAREWWDGFMTARKERAEAEASARAEYLEWRANPPSHKQLGYEVATAFKKVEDQFTMFEKAREQVARDWSERTPAERDADRQFHQLKELMGSLQCCLANMKK